LSVMAVVPAAGSSTRMGAGVKKQYLELEGIPVLARTLRVLEECFLVDGIVLVVGYGEEEYCRWNLVERYDFSKVMKIVAGGDKRQVSVLNGISILPSDTEIVVIHDGARPLLPPDRLVAVIEAAQKYGAATLAVPPKDTVKLGNARGLVVKTLPREELFLIQTPQAFHYQLILKAHKKAQEIQEDIQATDDAYLVELMRLPVKLVPGSYRNLKITTPEDLIVASAFLKEWRKRQLP